MASLQLDVCGHARFLKNLDAHKDRLDHWRASHSLRMSGLYWALTALLLLNPHLDPVEHSDHFSSLSPLSRDEILDFVFSCHQPHGVKNCCNISSNSRQKIESLGFEKADLNCQTKNGVSHTGSNPKDFESDDLWAFSGNVGDAPHVTFTLSAVQILCMLGALDDPRFHKVEVINWIVKLQNDDGSFFGDDEFFNKNSCLTIMKGEIDTRFTFCALATLRLLGATERINRNKAITYILRCQNTDGGFGVFPTAESHSGQVYCCLGSLHLLGFSFDDPQFNGVALAEWLAWRQLSCGGLNGRPEKLEDVCYSWWVLSSLAIMGKMHWISGSHLCDFILQCQDPDDGGFSDRPGDVSDPFHTLFAIAGLSLLSYADSLIAPVDPVLCMPLRFVEVQDI